MTAARRSARPAPIWDAPITIGLLLWGLITTIQTVAQARDLPASLQSAFSERGVGRYTQTGLATTIGWIVVVEAILSLALAIGFAVPRIRDHRLAFWIPVVAGVASGLVTVVLISIAILADPAYMASLQHATSGP